MTPREYLDVVRAHWRIVVACLCLGLLAAAAVTLLTPRRYAADVTIYIAAQPSDGDLGTALDGGELAAQRMATYLEVITSDRIAAEVAQQLGVSPADVAGEVSATASPDTVLLTATVVDPSPQRAVQIANLVAERFVANVAQLETPPGSTTAPLVTARIFEPARPSAGPVTPRPLFNLLLGGIVGLLAGLGLALLRHRNDTSVTSPEELREITGVPVLGAIEQDPAMTRHPLIVDHDRSSRVAEAFRRLRTNLQFLDVDRRRSLWLVTSAMPGDGKTSTVANLATVMADAGSRVLVVEADLRRPRLAELLGVDRTVGLTNVLVRRMPGGQAVQRVRSGLDVLASGMLPPNPSELLGSTAMAALLTQVRAEYDLVLLDASPLSPVADAVALAPQVDGVLLVVPHGAVDRQQLAAAVDTARSVSAPLLGTASRTSTAR